MLDFFTGGHVDWTQFAAGNAGLIDILYLGVKLGIYPCLIFIGVGAMTDFGPLIANPKSLLLGAAAQLGIFITFIGMRYCWAFCRKKPHRSVSSAALMARRRFMLHLRLAPALLRPNCGRRIFVYGLGTGYTAADYDVP